MVIYLSLTNKFHEASWVFINTRLLTSSFPVDKQVTVLFNSFQDFLEIAEDILLYLDVCVNI